METSVLQHPRDVAPPTGRSVVLVVPCFNEADRLDRAAFLSFARRNPAVGFLFVDDGSADGTGALLQELRGRHPDQVDVLSLDRNRGKAEAVRLGVLQAARTGAPLIGYWDADLATPLDEIARFLTEARQRPWAEIFIGSRIRLLGRAVHRSPARHFLGRLFAAAASLTLNLPVYDTQCGAKVFRNTPLLSRVFGRPFGSRWIFDVEVLARYMKEARPKLTRKGAGAAIAEVPLQEWTDVPGSKVKPLDFAVSFVELLKLRRSRRAVPGNATPPRTALLHSMWSRPEFDRRTGRSKAEIHEPAPAPPSSRRAVRFRLAAYVAACGGLWLSLHNKFSTARGSGTLSHLEHLWTSAASVVGLHMRYPGEFFYDHNLLIPGVIIAALAYGVALSGLWRRPVGIRELCLWAVVAGLPFVLLPRFQSTDLSDYILRARMEFVYHLNPFVYPSHFVPFDPFFYTSSWPQVRWVYGPLYLLLIGPIALVQRPVLAGVALRALTFGVHIANGALLWKVSPVDARRKIFFAGAYLLAPLLFIESAANAHNDFFMIFLFLSAVYFDRQRRAVPTALFLSAAFLIKLYAAPVLVCYLAATFRRSVKDAARAGLAAAALMAAFYAPFWAGPSILTAPFDGGSSTMLMHSLLTIAMAVSHIPDKVLIHAGLLMTVFFVLGGAAASFRTGRWQVCASYTMLFWCTLSSGWFWPWYVAAPVALAFASDDRPVRWAAVVLLFTDIAFYMEPTSWARPVGGALSVYMVVFLLPLAVLAFMWRFRHESVAERLLADLRMEPVSQTTV